MKRHKSTYIWASISPKKYLRLHVTGAPADAVSANKTWFKTWFKPPIQLDNKKDYEVALINLDRYYSLPNIDRSNICFTYSPKLNPLWFDIIIPEGSYHVEDINEFNQR